MPARQNRFGEDFVIAFRRVLISAGASLGLISFGLMSPALAQQNTGALSGSVLSSAGQAAAGASVTATGQASGSVYKTSTTIAGTYSFPMLDPGPYSVTFSMDGSKTTPANVEITVARRSVLNVRLEAGERTALAAEATMANQLMESESNVLGSAFSKVALGTAPLFVRGDLRNGETFVTWLPGVANGLSATQIAGGLRRGKEVLIDGASATSARDGGVVIPFPTGGQLSEFRLITNSLPAEFGRTSGGVEVWTARKGANNPHGELFDVLRHDALDAAGWAVNSARASKPKLRQNEYGFQLGGPVFIPEYYDGRKHGSFFNVSLNDYKQNAVDVSSLVTIPTLAMRAGDFTRLVNTAGQRIPIYDPATLVDKGFGLQRDLFTDNRIPASRFSAVSKAIQGYLPDPSNNGLTNNYVGRVTSALTRYAWGANFDQALSPDSRISIFTSVQKNDSDTRGPLPGVLSNGNRQYGHSQMYRANYQMSKDPDSSNQMTFAYTRARVFWDRQPEQVLNWSKTLGLAGIDNGGSSSFPVVNFTSGFASLGRSTDLRTRGGLYDRTLSVGDVSTRIRGRHELKMGFDARLGRSFQNPLSDTGVQGVFNFAALQTASPSALGTTGSSFASFLLGYVDSANRVFTSLAPDYRTAYGAIFVQDNFKFNNKLTLTVGLRYDLPFSRWDENRTYTSFDPNGVNPGAVGRKGSLAFSGKGAGHTGDKEFGTVDKKEFGPRIGMAYALDNKTTLRAGWGLLYANGNGLTAEGCSLCNLGSTSLVQRTSNGLQEAFLWDNGLTPQSTFRLPPQVDPALANGGPVVYINPNNGQAPRFQNYSVNVQRALPMGVLLDVAFAGNHGERLSGPLPLNQLDPKYLAQGSLLGLQITDAKVKAAGFSTPYAEFTGTLAQALRPYPQYGDITDPYSASLHSDYKALVIKADKQSANFTLAANYTYSRSTSNGAVSTVNTNLLAPQNQYDSAAEESRSIDDIPHVLNLVYSWNLPIGHGKMLLGNAHGILAALTGGWTVAAQQVYRSGSLLLVTAPNTLGSGVLYAARTQPNVTGQPFRTSIDAGALDPNSAASRWISPTAYSLAPAFAFGKAANFYDEVRNPGILVENISLVKKTSIQERLFVEYRVDVQNLFNRNLFGNINANLGDPGFGRPTGVMIQPRIIQMGLKLAF